MRRPGAESLPASLRAAHRLVPAEQACRDIHFPEDFDALEQARRRLTFEELFYLSAGLTLLKDRRDSQCSAAVFAPRPLEAFCALLPFAPTQAQRRAMEETARDLASGRPMNRLVQGTWAPVRPRWPPGGLGWPPKAAGSPR